MVLPMFRKKDVSPPTVVKPDSRPPGGKIVQISVSGEAIHGRRLYVLCEDNSVWMARDDGWVNCIPALTTNRKMTDKRITELVQ